jgi:TolB-like protein/Flp pilus assembly protein TadD
MAISPERWQEVEAIYHAALDRSKADRGPFLREACRGDQALLDEVESLLGFDSRGAKLLEQPAAVNAAARPALTPGRRLGAYEILGLLGAGGMGEVYRATDTRLGREVALKVLPPEMASGPERLVRFQREAKALAALDHPGIVTVHSVEEADGVHFLTMQLVEGQPLDKIIPEGGMPVDQLATVGTGLAEALIAAHERGIVHRDLKPGNAMLTDTGRVKVLDFGLAKTAGAFSGEATDPTLQTREGLVLGTMPYMSPEQVSGRPVDHRTDIFSLGVMLYELASGRRPFAGESPVELGSAILRDTPPDLTTLRPGLPHGLTRVISRCLEKDPAARFPSMRDVHDAMTAAFAGEGQSGTSWDHGPRSGALRIAGGVAITLALVFFVARSGIVPLPAQTPQTASEPRIRSIAVLPLDNYSGDPRQDYFAEGMTDELTADLARISQLRVISRGSAMQFKGGQRPPTPEIAKTLDVDAVVEGSVVRAGERVRITAQLIDARADRHLWAQSFERSSRDVLALQGELAAAIAHEIHVQLTPAEQSRLGSATRVNPEAYDAYLKGRYFFNRPSDENLQKAIARFEEAIAISPDFAPALSGLSDAYLWAGYNEGFMTASEARPRAKDAAEKAIRLDDTSAEGHTSLAVFKLFYEYDWAGSEVEFRRAFELSPNYAYAHDQFAVGLAFQGRFDESIAESRRAAELDPQNPQVPVDSIFALVWQGDYAKAKEQARRSVELDPTYFLPHHALGWIDMQEGNLRAAIPHLEKAKAMGAPAFASAWLAYAYATSGDLERAMAEVEDLEKLSARGSVVPFNLALVSLGQGDHARAVSYLEQAYASDSQWLGWLKYDHVFDPLRSNPRFAALMEKLGFENGG